MANKNDDGFDKLTNRDLSYIAFCNELRAYVEEHHHFANTNGNNVQIGVNAVVSKDVLDNCVVACIPAKIIKRLNPETGVWEKVNN